MTLWLSRLALANRWRFAALLVYLVALPAIYHIKVADQIRSPMLGFDNFMEKSKFLVRHDSACFSYSGEKDQVYFANSLFTRQESPCTPNFHIHFGRDWKGEIAFTPSDEKKYVEILTDEGNRILFRIFDPGNLPRTAAVSR
jgi:hypothetical protein